MTALPGAPPQAEDSRSGPLRAYLVIGLVVFLGPVASAAEERLEATYELLFGGLEIGRFEARLTTGETDYRMAYLARTTGFLGWLFPFVSEGASEGALDGAGPVPARYVGESRRPNGWSRWAVAFTPDGDALRVDLRSSIDEQRDPVPAALRRAPDPLALALRATRSIGPGARLTEIGFDGKRAVRFELACDDVERPVELVAAARTLGRILGCTLDGGVEAGRSRRWQDGRDEDREPARILFSREIAEGRYWPVRVEAETRFGMVIARLIGFR